MCERSNYLGCAQKTYPMMWTRLSWRASQICCRMTPVSFWVSAAPHGPFSTFLVGLSRSWWQIWKLNEQIICTLLEFILKTPDPNSLSWFSAVVRKLIEQLGNLTWSWMIFPLPILAPPFLILKLLTRWSGCAWAVRSGRWSLPVKEAGLVTNSILFFYLSQSRWI